MPCPALWVALRAAKLTRHRFLDPEDNRTLDDITLHRQLGVLLAQSEQLSPLALGQPGVAAFLNPPTIAAQAQLAPACAAVGERTSRLT
jgi:hypothetical protein